jgi:hypothetical protein
MRYWEVYLRRYYKPLWELMQGVRSKKVTNINSGVQGLIQGLASLNLPATLIDSATVRHAEITRRKL